MNSEVSSIGEKEFDDETAADLEQGEEERQESSDEDPATDNVGETSVEINVEDLIAEIEAESGRSSNPKGSATRKRLDDILEEKRSSRDLEDFEDLEFS